MGNLALSKALEKSSKGEQFDYLHLEIKLDHEQFLTVEFHSLKIDVFWQTT